MVAAVIPVPALAAPAVLALDQCADQYVLALSPREAIVGLSPRADDADSRLRAQAAGLPRRRATLEAALAARPEVVVRYWGGDERLLSALRARGSAVVTIREAAGFEDVRRNIRDVAAALGRVEEGEALVARMDARLARSAGAWQGRGALYLTPSGVTGGPGTLVDAILRGAGLTNLAPGPGFRTVSLEALAMRPPPAVVLGFFDPFMLANNRWGPGGHAVLRGLIDDRTVASLPAATLGCPDWSAAEAVEQLARRAPR